MRSLCIVFAGLLVAANVQSLHAGASGQPSDSDSEPVAVEDVNDLSVFERAALLMQLVLAPVDFARRAEPLHAYNNSVCSQSIASPQRYGRAAIVRRGRGDSLRATYYDDLAEACQVDNRGVYVATTLPIEDTALDDRLLVVADDPQQ